MDLSHKLAVASLALPVLIAALPRLGVKLPRWILWIVLIASAAVFIWGIAPVISKGFLLVTGQETGSPPPELKLFWGTDGELDGKIIGFAANKGDPLLVPEPGVWLTATADTNGKVRIYYSESLYHVWESPDPNWKSYAEISLDLQAGHRVRIAFPGSLPRVPAWMNVKLEVSGAKIAPLVKLFVFSVWES